MTDEEKLQKEKYGKAIKQKERLVNRIKNEVVDDVKDGTLPKKALIISGAHKIGVPTGVIQHGAVAVNETMMSLTKSDKQIVEYYANYDKNVQASDSEISNIVKQVDRQQESYMDAKADLETTKLEYLEHKQKIKQIDRFTKAEQLAKPLEDFQTGNTSDPYSLDD